MPRIRPPLSDQTQGDIDEIIGRVSNWSGGEEQALAWICEEPIAAFGGRTAKGLVEAGKAAAVRDYLDHIALGGFA